MGRPLFFFCLLTTACIWIGCRLHIFPDGSEQVIQTRELLLQEEGALIQGRVCERDSQSFYLEALKLVNAAAGQQGEYPSIQDSSSESDTISKKIKIKCEYSPQELGAIPKLGSMVLVKGDFAPFDRAGNPGQFDARKYYESKNICGRLEQCRVIWQSEAYSFLQEGLRRMRQRCSDRIYQLLPRAEASVLNTILLGEKQDMDGELKELYRTAGILHIASISGLHVMLIAMSIYRLLRKAGASIGISGVVSSILLILYGIMTGMSTSAVRAIAMFLIRMLGMVLGRTYDMLTALGLVGMLMVACHPAYLQDAGFLLSFGAVLGMGLLAPIFKKQEAKRFILRRVFSPELVRIGKKLGKNLVGVRDSFYSCMAVNLILLPILLWYYYEVPVYSWILNLLIIPSLSVLAVVGLGIMAIPVLGFLAPLETELLRLYENLCQWVQQWPGHTWCPGRPEGWAVMAYYLLLGLIIALKSKGFQDWMKRYLYSKSKMLFVRVILCYIRLLPIILLMVGICLLGCHPRENRVTFLDVGQGDCICVETVSGQVYLFDCGSSSQSKVGQYVLKPYLKYYGIHEIDGLFLSHSDSDHCNGVIELLENQEAWGITVKRLFLPGTALTDFQGQQPGRESVRAEQMSSSDARYSRQMSRDWENILDVVGCPVEYVSAGDLATTTDMKLLCLHPRQNQDYQDGNQASQCFYLELGAGADAFTVLLTGDVEGNGEAQLLEALAGYGISEVDVLKVAHHGSKNGTSEQFLEQIDAQMAVISCGERNVYGHPHTDTLERLTEDGTVIMTTPERGAVKVRKGLLLEVQSWISPSKERK
ncbi:MAG: DNA internalization-related competence protein ComEC/Rec2 [Lachnospiraceae bacterium]|nr:DNA internalization-related competence protein ComEC/Rec2 [Lachnospiraceae bacterium]